MYGRLSEEIEVKVPASEAWKVYGTLLLADPVCTSLPSVNKIDVVQGDGGVGTILHVSVTHPGTGKLLSFKEKFTVVDDEKRVKAAEVVEGGFLDLGFAMYRTRFEVIEKEGSEKECITRSTIEYEVKEESAANAAFVSIQPLVTLMHAAADHLLLNYNK